MKRCRKRRIDQGRTDEGTLHLSLEKGRREVFWDEVYSSV